MVRRQQSRQPTGKQCWWPGNKPPAVQRHQRGAWHSSGAATGNSSQPASHKPATASAHAHLIQKDDHRPARPGLLGSCCKGITQALLRLACEGAQDSIQHGAMPCNRDLPCCSHHQLACHLKPEWVAIIHSAVQPVDAPVNAPTTAAAVTRCTAAPHSLATACTAAVLPQPGGPCSRRPLGQRRPSIAASSAYRTGQLMACKTQARKRWDGKHAVVAGQADSGGSSSRSSSRRACCACLDAIFLALWAQAHLPQRL